MRTLHSQFLKNVFFIEPEKTYRQKQMRSKKSKPSHMMTDHFVLFEIPENRFNADYSIQNLL